MRTFLFIFILGFAFSCSRQILVSNKGCKTRARWSESKSEREGRLFKIEEDIIMTSGTYEVNLVQVLKESNIDCKNVQYLS